MEVCYEIGRKRAILPMTVKEVKKRDPDIGVIITGDYKNRDIFILRY
jgi:hypothetical protein